MGVCWFMWLSAFRVWWGWAFALGLSGFECEVSDLFFELGEGFVVGEEEGEDEVVVGDGEAEAVGGACVAAARVIISSQISGSSPRRGVLKPLTRGIASSMTDPRDNVASSI